MIADCFFFCRVAHAAPLHPRRCHRHFCTFGLHALYGVWLARLMCRNPSPRFRLLWRKPALYCATTAASGGCFPRNPLAPQLTLRRFSGCSLHALPNTAGQSLRQFACLSSTLFYRENTCISLIFILYLLKEAICVQILKAVYGGSSVEKRCKNFA